MVADTIPQDLSIIPALLHAAVLGLLTGALPMKGIATAVTLAIPEEEGQRIIVSPTIKQAQDAKSVHTLGFTSRDELLLSESRGSFTLEEWQEILEVGQRVCCQHQQSGLETDVDMGEAGAETAASVSIRDFIRSAMETKTAGDLHWK
jgi:exosome complex component RRP46